jgi:hypothetical protein
MLGVLGDPLLTPALDASEVDLGKINGHPSRLSVDVGEVAVQGRLRDCGLARDLAEAVTPAVELSRTRFRQRVEAAEASAGGFGDDAGARGAFSAVDVFHLPPQVQQEGGRPMLSSAVLIGSGSASERTPTAHEPLSTSHARAVSGRPPILLTVKPAAGSGAVACVGNAWWHCCIERSVHPN